MEHSEEKDGMMGVDQMSGMQLNNGEFQELRIILNGNLRHTMSTAVTFDTHQQLFWCGTETGHVTSYYGTNFMKYTAFQAHHEFTRKILPDAHGVLSLCPSQVRYTTKEGLKIFSAGSDNMHSMQSMVRFEGPRDNQVLIAGQNEHFFELDLTSGYVSQKNGVNCEPNTVVMKQHSRGYLCCGQQGGEVILYDPDTLKPCHTIEAHSSALSDFDVHNNLLVTCGFSTRYGHLTVDPYLMVYDIRTLRPFHTVHVPVEPLFVKFLPTYTVRALVVSQTGQFILAQPDSIVVDPGIYQVNNQGQSIMDCCVSETYQAIGFADSAGLVHVWSDRDESQLLFNHGEQSIVLPDETPHLDAFDIDDWSIPLTGIPMPYTNEPLLSDWPEHLLRRVDRPTPPIDPDILKNMTIRQFVGYAPNPKKRLRNQVAYPLLNEKGYKSPDSPMSRDNDGSLVPKMYRKVEIKYSKYGIEDFNFRHYNQTKFSGLEIHIPNAYCNSMLQVLYYFDVLRVGLQNHICQREFCVACELGFLFYMLDISDGQTCQATNFLRTFRTLPEASALGLLVSDNDSGRKNKSIAQTIQNWNRFVLRQLHQDTRENPKDNNCSLNEGTEKKNEGGKDESAAETTATESKDEVKSDSPEKKEAKTSGFEDPSLIKRLFGMDILSCRTCKCNAEHEREVTIFATDLAYPDIKPESDEIYPFTKLLQESIMRKQNTQAWCDRCQKYQNSKQYRKIVSLPDVFAINCQLEHSKEIEFWKKQQELAEPKSTPMRLPNMSPPKLCRYGKFCNRQGCKFVHHRDGGQMSRTQSMDSEFESKSQIKQWISSSFEVVHNLETSEVNLRPYEKPEEKMEEEEEEVEEEEAEVEESNEERKEEKKEGDADKTDEKANAEESSEKKETEENVEVKGEKEEDKKEERVDEDADENTEKKEAEKAVEDVVAVEKEKEEKVVESETEVTEKVEPEEKNEKEEEEKPDVIEEEEEEDVGITQKFTYTLLSNVCHINDSATGATLVSHIHANEEYHKRKDDVEKKQWYVFNDFAITPIAEHDAVTFNMEWKVPSVLVYVRDDIRSKYEEECKFPIDSQVMCADKSLASKQGRFNRNFTALNSTEILKEGDIVGVDAEFVTLNQEESEMRRDGTLSTLRPSQMSVARITVVRGWGPLQGVPFIDDYISTSEQVVDYLTKFSGIKPGDLDATISSKHLTTLKTSYQKLRYLIEQKVLFIGHGLKKDFRVINLVIPRDQVVDTVELFHLPKQRYVSLKFLAWHFLNIKIQADTHDSAEDAYTALKLYDKYRELLRAGEWVLEEELEILYETGRQYNWSVPE